MGGITKYTIQQKHSVTRYFFLLVFLSASGANSQTISYYQPLSYIPYARPSLIRHPRIRGMPHLTRFTIAVGELTWLDLCSTPSLIPLAPCYTSNNLSSATSWMCNNWRGHDGRLTFAPARDAAGGLAAGHRRLYQAPTEIRHPRRTSLHAPGGSTQPGAMSPNPPNHGGQAPGVFASAPKPPMHEN